MSLMHNMYSPFGSDKLQVLVVQEKYCASTSVGAWKLPTGFIHEVLILIIMYFQVNHIWQATLFFPVLCFTKRRFMFLSVWGDLFWSCERSQGGNWCKKKRSTFSFFLCLMSNKISTECTAYCCADWYRVRGSHIF